MSRFQLSALATFYVVFSFFLYCRSVSFSPNGDIENRSGSYALEVS